jgi:hypothetical protein
MGSTESRPQPTYVEEWQLEAARKTFLVPDPTRGQPEPFQVQVQSCSLTLLLPHISQRPLPTTPASLRQSPQRTHLVCPRASHMLFLAAEGESI